MNSVSRCGYFALVGALLGIASTAHGGEKSPEARAIAFLAAEVPKWHAEKHCHSCHNSGDAARALMWAADAGLLPDKSPLAETLEYLSEPATWDADGPDGPFKDRQLARIQFAAALAEAHGAGVLDHRDALAQAAALVAELQSPEGFWDTDMPGTLGSPVTYGRALATALAQRVLRATGDEQYDDAILKAQGWFETTEAKSVLDAAATMLALAPYRNQEAQARREQCLRLIRQGQSPDGGWGPFANSAPEAFDTALVVLALSIESQRPQQGKPDEARREVLQQIQRGRAYLVAAQEADGGWPPTTRPPGVDSYAQRLSTTGWATQALLATRGK
ncbi:MAG: hypothetical protein AB7O59_13635 [Pirellulales bacterium]